MLASGSSAKHLNNETSGHIIVSVVSLVTLLCHYIHYFANALYRDEKD